MNSTTSKSPEVIELISKASEILRSLGVITTERRRRIDRISMVFLACCNVYDLKHFREAAKRTESHALRTRDIIAFCNKHFEENIADSSYDDIRRRDLEPLMLAGLVEKSLPGTATNDSRRAYVLSLTYKPLIEKCFDYNWNEQVEEFFSDKSRLTAIVARKREITKIPITIPGRGTIEFSPGEHNILQKAIVEEFLPRFGFGAELLYIGDTDNKYLHLDSDRLSEIGFFNLSHDELPDIVAYSKNKSWIYLIEAVHSSGPISEFRMLRLKGLLNQGIANNVVYVTAFLTRAKFRQFVGEIAWESEVWIADTPDHLVHFNGDKFLGPYSTS